MQFFRSFFTPRSTNNCPLEYGKDLRLSRLCACFYKIFIGGSLLRFFSVFSNKSAFRYLAMCDVFFDQEIFFIFRQIFYPEGFLPRIFSFDFFVTLRLFEVVSGHEVPPEWEFTTNHCRDSVTFKIEL